MSFIVNGMEMPKGCFFCPLVGGDYRCRISHWDVSRHTFRRHDDCPLVEIPTEHGRLITEPTEEEIVETIGGNNGFAECIREAVKAVFDNAKTIIPTDKGDANADSD